MRLFLVLASSICLCSSVLRAQAASQSAAERTVEFLQRHNQVGVVMGSFVSRIDIRATLPTPCVMSLVLRTTSGSGRTQSGPDVAESTIPLAELSPDATVRAWESGGLFSVDLRVSSGDSSIVVKRTMDSRPSSTRRAYRTELVVDTRTAADSLADIVSAAIRECGGRAPSREVTARLNAADSASSASVDRLLGNSLSPAIRTAAIAACHDQVKTRLRAPSTARFDAVSPPGLTVDSKTEELSIIGSVEAQNAAGGRRENSYLCVLEKVGARYIPKSTSVF